MDIIIFCIDCNKKLSKKAYYYKYKRCGSCSKKFRFKNKINHPSYIDGRSLKIYYCIDCGDKISWGNGFYGNKRCYSCNAKGKRNPNWKNGLTLKLYFCIKCGKRISYKSKKCNSCSKKNFWSNPLNRKLQIEKVLRGTFIKPNKSEVFLKNILENLIPNIYEYVGNGKLIIGGFCPDFIDKKNKKIIELFGDYWHNRPETKIRDVQRIKTFNSLGYKTLVIWESELFKNTNKIKEKLEKFNGGV